MTRALHNDHRKGLLELKDDGHWRPIGTPRDEKAEHARARRPAS